MATPTRSKTAACRKVGYPYQYGLLEVMHEKSTHRANSARYVYIVDINSMLMLFIDMGEIVEQTATVT